uniref:Putative replication protein A1 n=1 Tax=Arabidopsis thaliana TaxID=3702 RepID=Q9SKJ1_ARATH|nr:putative replication protein A1 [Arabidopsis thaliana]
MAYFDGICDLSPFITGWTICVMVLRTYKRFYRDNAFELRVVFVDEWGIQIEAIIERYFSQCYFDKLKENQWKEIATFRVIPNSGIVRAITHYYMIEFMEATSVISSDPRGTAFLTDSHLLTTLLKTPFIPILWSIWLVHSSISDV